jgi:hypothetical protein
MSDGFSASWPGLSRPSTSFLLRPPQGVDARHKAGHDAGGPHFTGATATAMVQTSLPRLMISRLSFGPM